MNCVGAALLALIACLGNPDPQIRDKTAFERISAELRGGAVDRETLAKAQAQLLALLAAPDPQGFQRPFAILALAEVARTDRIKPWMPDADRQRLVDTATTYVSNVTDYRAFDNNEGFRHGVAHGADLVTQLALNAAIPKPQLDRLLDAVAAQVVPKDPKVAYWAGEPDRLARAVGVIAQRNLHSDLDWRYWVEKVAATQPHARWLEAFNSEAGIRQRHNMRAFLLSLLASASSTEDAGLRKLAAPIRDALRQIG
jgi:hypothetical protein